MAFMKRSGAVARPISKKGWKALQEGSVTAFDAEFESEILSEAEIELKKKAELAVK
jgi:hypothetical protein